MSKSEQIRKLYSEGLTKGEIAKTLDIRFQFVYNVLTADANKKILAAAKAAQNEKNEG